MEPRPRGGAPWADVWARRARRLATESQTSGGAALLNRPGKPGRHVLGACSLRAGEVVRIVASTLIRRRPRLRLVGQRLPSREEVSVAARVTGRLPDGVELRLDRTRVLLGGVVGLPGLASFGDRSGAGRGGSCVGADAASISGQKSCQGSAS